MNLLEINANKLKDLLRCDFDEGLTSEQVEKNRVEFSSSNTKSKNKFFSTLKNAFSDVMPLIFVFLSIISLTFEKDTGAWLSLIFFIGIYVIFKYFSYAYSAKVYKTVNTAPSKAKVIRDGVEREIDFSEIVPGDILLVGFGDVIPCDGIIIWQKTLRVSEIQLTGNARPVLKLTQEDVINGNGVPYYECILFAGSVVTTGRAKVLVCNVGKDVFDKKNKLTTRSKHAHRTRIFEIASFMAKQVSLIWILVSFFAFIVGVIKGYNEFNLLYLTVTLAVASMPELVLTLFDLTMSIGSKRLYKKGCTVRDMSALDRMCDISCIMIDNSRYFRNANPRPNTIYVNDEKKKFRLATDPDVRELFELALAASVSDENSLSYNGVGIEHSLIKTGEEIGIRQSDVWQKYLVLEKKPYTREDPMSRVIVFRDHEFFIVALGTPSVVLRSSSYVEVRGETQILDERSRRSIRDLSKTIASDNEGVVAVAIKKIEYREGLGQIENKRGFSFKGYIGLHTSIRADSAKAVNTCDKSGIDIVLMTREGYSTSVGIAKSLSILKENEKHIESKNIDFEDSGLFRTEIKDYKVYASLTPLQRARIARFRKEEGDIIATTVSSVDEFSLLLESDVSFCPEDIDSQAVLQNTDVVIKGGFELIPECIKSARAIYRNTRHMLEYFMNFQFTLLFTTLISMTMLGFFIFTPASVMTYAVLVALPMALSLAAENVRGNELKDNFGSQSTNINVHNILLIPAISALTGGAVILMIAKTLELSSALRSSISGAAFIALVTSSVFMAWALSSDSGFDKSIFRNKELILTTLFEILIITLFVLVKPLSAIIGITIPDVQTVLLAIITSLIPALVCTGIKLIKKYVFEKN
ncbi:MAG: cation-transporting P-type ATPase [Ruminococcaceae bacterium]|nr:cation-transporting P-type ATPase [Oscillospiraceae bacterium]